MEDRALCLCPLIEADDYPTLWHGLQENRTFLSPLWSVVSQYLAQELHRRVRRSILEADPRDVTPDVVASILEEVIGDLDGEVLEILAKSDGEAGSTAIVAVALNFESLVVAHVGNSACVVCSSEPPGCQSVVRSGDLGPMLNEAIQESRVVQQTRPHCPGDAEERGRIEKTGANVAYTNGAWRIDGGLEISRSIGDMSYRGRGVVAIPTISHFSLRTGVGSVVLASDGVFERLSADEICLLVEETKLKCARKFRTPPPEAAIPLGGETLPQTHPSSACEPLRLGMEVREAWGGVMGLQGCGDCLTERSCPVIDAAVFHNFGNSEDVLASTLVAEAFDRRASDNLAVALLDLREAKSHKPLSQSYAQDGRQTQHFVASALPDVLERGLIVRSGVTRAAYELLDKVMCIPRGHHLVPVDVRSRTPSQTEAESTLEQCILEEWTEDIEHSVMLFRPLELLSEVVHHEVVGTTQPLPESCVPQYYLEAVDWDLIRVLGSRPRAEETQSEALTPSAECFEQLSHYKLRKKFAGGGFGEIWRAVLRGQTADAEDYVLKRIRSEKGGGALLSGIREAYFGALLQQHSSQETNYLVRFVESFEMEYGNELWLVFRDEGVSLHDLMYTSEGAGEFQIVQPSAWWHRLRQSQDGALFERRLIHQLLKALQNLHALNVTHRDIKPENVLIEGTGLPDPAAFKIRLIDFGSAIDPVSMETYYGDDGPSDREQTKEYAPPEALFEKLVYQPQLASHYYAYDMWSVGILWVEFILGTPHVFELPAKTRALVERDLLPFHLKEGDTEKAILLRAMMEFCIYPPWSFPDTGVAKNASVKERPLVRWKCTEQSMLELLKMRDMHAVGVGSEAALRLLMSLLAWNPHDRLTASVGLQSPLFEGLD